MPNRCFPSPPQVLAPRRRVPIWTSQNTCFSVFTALGLEKRSVLLCLGRSGSKGQSCHVPGASWPSKSPQIASKVLVLLYLLAWWFEGRVFFAFCVVFSRVRPSIRSRRRSRNAVFHFSVWPLKGFRFYSNCWHIPGAFGVGIL